METFSERPTRHTSTAKNLSNSCWEVQVRDGLWKRVWGSPWHRTVHTAEATHKQLKGKYLKGLELPSQSPDHNPIEVRIEDYSSPAEPIQLENLEQFGCGKGKNPSKELWQLLKIQNMAWQGASMTMYAGCLLVYFRGHLLPKKTTQKVFISFFIVTYRALKALDIRPNTIWLLSKNIVELPGMK